MVGAAGIEPATPAMSKITPQAELVQNKKRIQGLRELSCGTPDSSVAGRFSPRIGPKIQRLVRFK
jgi:hypothetical protein